MDWQAVLERQSFQDDDDLDIAETLIALSAADHPGRDFTAERTHLESLAEGISEQTPLAGELSRRLAGELGYLGDSETYDDMRNADIAAVIERRRGLPVALGLLYIHAGRTLGWDITGINFPGHFLLRLRNGDGHEIIDPFGGGQVVQPSDMKAMLAHMAGGEARLHPSYMASTAVRHVIVRLQNNIKIRALQAGDTDRALEILRRMSLFAPATSSIWLEWSGIMAGQGNMRRAIALLEEGADHAPDETALQTMAEARLALGRRLN
ncbi:SirB1 family protein [Minwuia sp.]|uniref:SirB1 family protein n=1 Tax=Minwuia sp. TaxID=2493630 RepID=UPI003A93E738